MGSRVGCSALVNLVRECRRRSRKCFDWLLLVLTGHEWSWVAGRAEPCLSIAAGAESQIITREEDRRHRCPASAMLGRAARISHNLLT